MIKYFTNNIHSLLNPFLLFQSKVLVQKIKIETYPAILVKMHYLGKSSRE